MEKIFLATLFVLMMISSTALAASIEIRGERSSPEYWLKPDGDRVLLGAAQIKTLNNQMRAKDSYAENLSNYPAQLPASEVQAMLRAASQNNSIEINSPIEVKYAVTVRRADMRLEPKPWSGDKYDDLQATALDPAEAVAVLLERDQYCFCQARNYFGWINRNELAFTDRVTWQSYITPSEFLVVVDNKKHVNVEGRDLLFQMGAIIPLIQTVEPQKYSNDFRITSSGNVQFNIRIPAFPEAIANRTESEWLARLPISVKGRLREVYVPIVDDASINLGWLPCTHNNFIRQAFKFLGDEYGWGGLNESVDCSAFVGDVYRSMGIEIPRDANRQDAVMPIFAVFNDVGTYKRFDIVRRAPIGSLLFKPGHVMMKLGVDKNGTPLVIHAASSYVSNGERIFIRKVIVSDLYYQGVAGVDTIDQLIGIGKVAD